MYLGREQKCMDFKALQQKVLCSNPIITKNRREKEIVLVHFGMPYIFFLSLRIGKIGLPRRVRIIITSLNTQ
jgi:hypothetical protein